jgi:hypothetical protein
VVHRELFDVYQLHLEIFEVVVIQTKLPLERPIGRAALPLEDLYNAGEHLIKVHQRPSTCASAASTWGSQNIISMA